LQSHCKGFFSSLVPAIWRCGIARRAGGAFSIPATKFP
jgi:hypothetical protein